MWLYYSLLSTVIWGFVAIAIKKCSNNEPKRVAMMGMLIYHSIILAIDKKNDQDIINKKAKQKAIMYSWGVVLFYGISDLY